MKIIYQSPIKGNHQDISHAPDQVFSKKMVGAGFVIEPLNGILYAPIDGVITLIMPTKHAIAIKHESGIDLLIHIGFESGWNGVSSIQLEVELGMSVKKGDILAHIDLEALAKHATSTAISVVFVQKYHIVIQKESIKNDMIELELDIT